MGRIKDAIAEYKRAIQATAPGDIATRTSLKGAIKALQTGQS